MGDPLSQGKYPRPSPELLPSAACCKLLSLMVIFILLERRARVARLPSAAGIALQLGAFEQTPQSNLGMVAQTDVHLVHSPPYRLWRDRALGPAHGDRPSVLVQRVHHFWV